MTQQSNSFDLSLLFARRGIRGKHVALVDTFHFAPSQKQNATNHGSLVRFTNQSQSDRFPIFLISYSSFRPKDLPSSQERKIVMNSMISKSFAARRAVASRIKNGATRRTYHATSALLGDALDMVDSFPRRHCKYSKYLAWFDSF